MSEIESGQNTNNPEPAPVVEQAGAEPQSVEQPAPANSGDAQPAQEQADDSLLTGTESEAKTAEGEEQTEGKDEETSILGAPEEYAFDGVDASDLGIRGFSEVAKELNLSQEAATTIMERSMAGMREQLAKQRAELRKEAMASKELDFSNPEVANQTQSAFKRYFADKPRLQAKLRAFNLDVDPDFVGVIKRIGADMAEGSFVQGVRGHEPQTAGIDYRKLYPNTKMDY